MQGQKPGKPGRGPVVPQECEECGTGFQIGGPIWTPPLANKAFVQKLLDAVGPESTYAPGIGLATRPRINGMMTAVLEEVETPLYHDLPSMCGILHCTCPPMEQFHAALVNAGYVLCIRLHTNMAQLVGLIYAGEYTRSISAFVAQSCLLFPPRILCYCLAPTSRVSLSNQHK